MATSVDLRWLRLLKAQKARSSGLTFPFLVGALRRPIGAAENNESAAKDQLRELIRSIDAGTVGILVHECQEIHQPLATITYVTRIVDKAWQVPEGPTRALQLSNQYQFHVGEYSVDSLTDFLWGYCGKAIMDGTFSFRESKYQPFSEIDIEFIEKSLS